MGIRIHSSAVVHEKAVIGDGTQIWLFCQVRENVTIGENCRIGANVTLSHCLIGDRVILHPGVQVGQDGFGFVPGPAGLLKIPQLGRALIESDVEIGATQSATGKASSGGDITFIGAPPVFNKDESSGGDISLKAP